MPEVFFTKRSFENEKQCKTYKILFEKIQNYCKTLYYQDKVSKLQTEI